MQVARAAAVRGAEAGSHDPGFFEPGYCLVQSTFQMLCGADYCKIFFHSPGREIIHVPVEFAGPGTVLMTSKALV